MSFVAAAIIISGAAAAGTSAYSSSQANKTSKKASQAMQDIQDQIMKQGAMTPQESDQYNNSFGLGNQYSDILKYMQGIGSAPAGYQNAEQQYQNQGPLAQQLYGTAMSDVQNPYASYESNLQPSLQQAQDQINNQAVGRGLLSSGIPIEQMGRAGVELAIQEANNRMNWRQQMLQNASGVESTASGLQQQNLANMGNLYYQQQSLGEAAKARSAGQAVQAGQYAAAGPSAQLGYSYGQQAAASQLSGQVLGAAGQYAVASAPQNINVNQTGVQQAGASQATYNPYAYGNPYQYGYGSSQATQSAYNTMMGNLGKSN